MTATGLPVGCFLRVEKAGLQELIDRLFEMGYRVVGPRVAGGAVVLDDVRSVAEFPVGLADEQEAGRYRLVPGAEGAVFDHVVGPQGLKNLLFPPRATLVELTLANGRGWAATVPPPPERPIAAIGVRSCDLHALAIQDRVFLEGPFVSEDYAARRRGLFIAAVNCGRAAATCFCTSMDTGPAVTGGFDLALTELPGGFVVEVGSERGGEAVAGIRWVPCSTRDVAEAQQVPRRAERAMEQRRHARPGEPGAGRYLERAGVRELLLENLEHERWDAVAERCLACGNCTMVCPTCFCATVDDVSDLSGAHVARERVWESCFDAEHSYMNSGTVRKSIRARYRQWLTHKLATWIDQFGTSGCTGCGRCITWCPVGIDLTAEVAALRGGVS
jgi:ferredoxin